MAQPPRLDQLKHLMDLDESFRWAASAIVLDLPVDYAFVYFATRIVAVHDSDKEVRMPKEPMAPPAFQVGDHVSVHEPGGYGTEYRILELLPIGQVLIELVGHDTFKPRRRVLISQLMSTAP